MPFGFRCEYATFDECVAAQLNKGRTLQSARRMCGAIKRDTETKCARRTSENVHSEFDGGGSGTNVQTKASAKSKRWKRKAQRREARARQKIEE
jgi:hypothetical protein